MDKNSNDTKIVKIIFRKKAITIKRFQFSLGATFYAISSDEL
jgi:hypothetical protein